MVKKINETEFNAEAMTGVSLVDFSATWCGPCKMLAPVLEEVSEEMQGKLNFFNVDVDECGDLAAKYGIMSVPSLLILKDGVKAKMLVGFKAKEALIEEINKALA